MLIPNHNSFRVLWLPCILFEKYIYILAHRKWPDQGTTALCQLYRHTFVRYGHGRRKVTHYNCYVTTISGFTTFLVAGLHASNTARSPRQQFPARSNLAISRTWHSTAAICRRFLIFILMVSRSRSSSLLLFPSRALRAVDVTSFRLRKVVATRCTAVYVPLCLCMGTCRDSLNKINLTIYIKYLCL